MRIVGYQVSGFQFMQVPSTPEGYCYSVDLNYSLPIHVLEKLGKPLIEEDLKIEVRPYSNGDMLIYTNLKTLTDIDFDKIAKAVEFVINNTHTLSEEQEQEGIKKAILTPNRD